MGIGTQVRHRLGRLEVPAATAYRSVFVSLPKVARRIAARVDAERILEVGCGDGSLGTELLRTYPNARYTGIDVAATVGRLFRGDRGRAEFRTITAQDFAAARPTPYDLVVLVDVLHHVPRDLRAEVLRCSAELVRPNGFLMVKEFERNRGAYYYLTYAADRYVTGDRGVSFMTMAELGSMVRGPTGFGPTTFTRIGPARNNVLFARQRWADQESSSANR